MLEDRNYLDVDEDDLEWETLSEVHPPRRQLTPAQRAYLERKKDRPQGSDASEFWRDLYKPLDWDERNVPHDEQEQGRERGE